MVLWNTHGSKRFPKSRDFIKYFDVVILQETWLDNDKANKMLGKLDANFKYWIKSAVKIKGKKGRLSGGQIIGIRKNVLDGWIVNEWEFGMLIYFNRDICTITVYNNVGMTGLDCKLRKIIEECMSNYETVLLCGDMNSRVGEEQVCNESTDEGMYQKFRNSEDKVINESGKKLLKLSEDIGLILLNGRANGDENGKITYIGGNYMFTGSVIDLVFLVDRENLEIIKKLEIVPRIESDHLPVTFHIRVNNSSFSKSKTIVEKEKVKIEKII